MLRKQPYNFMLIHRGLGTGAPCSGHGRSPHARAGVVWPSASLQILRYVTVFRTPYSVRLHPLCAPVGTRCRNIRGTMLHTAVSNHLYTPAPCSISICKAMSCPWVAARFSGVL